MSTKVTQATGQEQTSATTILRCQQLGMTYTEGPNNVEAVSYTHLTLPTIYSV